MAIPLLIDDRCHALAFRPLSCPCPGVLACPRCPTAIDKIDISYYRRDRYKNIAEPIRPGYYVDFGIFRGDYL